MGAAPVSGLAVKTQAARGGLAHVNTHLETKTSTSAGLDRVQVHSTASQPDVKESHPPSRGDGDGGSRPVTVYSEKKGEKKEKKERELAEGLIIKYVWYSEKFHRAQMSHSGTLRCFIGSLRV